MICKFRLPFIPTSIINLVDSGRSTGRATFALYYLHFKKKKESGFFGFFGFCFFWFNRFNHGFLWPSRAKGVVLPSLLVVE